MRRRPKTSDELHTDLKTFEAVWKQEMAKVMRNAVERMIAVRGSTPPRYKMKLPRFLRTVVEPSQNLSVAVRATRPLRLRAPARKKPLAPLEQKRFARVEEYRQLRQALADSLKRAVASYDGHAASDDNQIPFPESPDSAVNAEATNVPQSD